MVDEDGPDERAIGPGRVASDQEKPKAECKQGTIARTRLFKLAAFIISFIIIPILTQLYISHMSAQTNTMAIVPYSPLNAQLSLNISPNSQDIINSVSPLHYKLSDDDFNIIHLPNKILFILDESVGSALFFVLQQLAWKIVKAGHAHILNHIHIAPSNLRPLQFNELGLAQPAILHIGHFKGRHNPLYFASTREDLIQLHHALQTVGRQAVTWIATAAEQSTQLGPQCSWNWNTAYIRPSLQPAPKDPRIRQVKFPTRNLITSAESKQVNLRNPIDHKLTS
jgi:hypothetical protein